MNVYLDGFTNNEDIISEFDAPKDALDGAEVLFAEYTYADYEGNAFVLYRKDGTLYEVSGGHCSCYGLEGQWDPEQTTPEALAKRSYFTGQLKDIIESQSNPINPETGVSDVLTCDMPSTKAAGE
jgi:hypothetical protein